MNKGNGEPDAPPAAATATADPQPLPAEFARLQTRALEDLARLARHTVEREADLQKHLEQVGGEIQARDSRARHRITSRYEKYSRAVKARLDRDLPELETRRSTAQAQADKQYRSAREELKDQEELSERKIRKKLENDLWMADSLHEMRLTAAREKHQKADVLFQRREKDTQALFARVEQQHRRHLMRPPEVQQQVEEAAAEIEAVDDYDTAREQVVQSLDRFPRLVPSLLFGGWSYILAGLIVAGAIGGALSQLQPDADSQTQGTMLGGALLGGLIIALGGGWALRFHGRRRLTARYQNLLPALAALHAAMTAEKRTADEAHEAERADSQQQRNDERDRAKGKHAPLLEKFTARRKKLTDQIQARYKQRCEAIQAEADQIAGSIEQWRREKTDAVEGQFSRSISQLDARTNKRQQALDDEAEQAYQQLQDRWAQGTQPMRQVLDQVDHLPDVYHHPWHDHDWSDWQPARPAAAVIRIGQLHVEPDRMSGSSGGSDRYRTNLPHAFDLPATLAFAEHGSLMFEHDAPSRDAALALLRSIVARLMVTLPPARARFTFIDPVGLGATFAGFMHLADYNELLVGQRIWTEPEHIQRRLAELTEHMETVIQKYLRNEFATIDAFNAQAGELAEPYRFLVLADFPKNIDEAAAQRLHAIMTNGARCGVYVLLARDRRHPLPTGLTVDDLRAAATTLTHERKTFTWPDEPYKHYPLTLDAPPTDEQLSQIVRTVGNKAREGDRVEMPFSTIAPTPAEFWTATCDFELRVPIGRSGATRMQELSLGKGVAQHALMAGKTGSGKSTLMHAMVTNLALWYSPDQVEFYLVDFKKGVEFKTYATHNLPHARAVAVESDREFGLSVLRRLDAELEHRGELFRKAGVQVLGEYRRAVPDQPMPRSLLIIDEFQELFSQDDKIAQDASLLIDRLVRQGRAFGIHVLLGSQTLAGGGGLSRSTIGQMAIRIALQCNESDSQLIFEDTNAAARLLTRPGEAIYNDAGGAIEGNNPFQVAWLDDRQREHYLSEASRLAAERFPDAEPPIVFEGNAAADVRKNRTLAALLQAQTPPATPPNEPLIWLGEPITIKAPSAAVLARRSGSNLLMVGQRDEAALAMFAAGLLSLAAQHSPEDATFLIFDATPADSPHADLLARVAAAVPHDARIVPPSETDEAFTQLNEELTSRQQPGSEADHLPACFIFIVGLQRYRTLRKKEDDFSLSFRDEDESAAPSPDKIFAELLREGPPLGMHVVTWADTPIALDRTLDRSALREFDWRVLFQMSATDSANLIDSPEAATLGQYRAILCSEEQGVFEKFRPYEPLEKTWLNQLPNKITNPQQQ
ncbi:MAG: FtsK/SpoIIIE domain-containing protein [Phycisphaeraceae bacterium]